MKEQKQNLPGNKNKKNKINEEITYSIILMISILLAMSSLYLLSTTSKTPTAMVILSQSPDNNKIFNQQNIYLKCHSESNNTIKNMTIKVYSSNNTLIRKKTIIITTNQTNYTKEFRINNLQNSNYKYYCTACDKKECEESTNSSFTVNITSKETYLNLTFDNSSNPLKDYSYLNHEINLTGEASWLNNDECKWEGCLDLTADGNDYIITKTLFKPGNSIAISFWYKPIISPSQENQWYFQISSGSSEMSTQESQYGISSDWKATEGRIGSSTGSSYTTEENKWTHYFISYDGKEYKVWKNGRLIKNDTENKGELLAGINETMKIGAGSYGINLRGYLDEFIIYSRGNFTSEEVKKIYDSKKLGTPPKKDLYIKNLTYDLPINWNDSLNRLYSDELQIRLTIKNQGTEATSQFNYKIILDEKTICQGRTSLEARSSKTENCTITLEQGFHKGKAIIDYDNEVQEDNEDNNELNIYIPFINRPWYHFTKQEWDSELQPIASNPEIRVANEDYNWVKSFSCDPFNKNYDGNDVDPYGKKARECALSCFVNNYTDPNYPDKQPCHYAKEHLLGWANINPETYSNVQAIHELAELGIAYDIMFPTLTKEENENITKGFYKICQHITNLPNTRPDLDEEGTISGGNGWGFGSGMGGFCYAIIGSYNKNPDLIQERDQEYWGESIPTLWMNREQAYLKGFKNDSYANYQEGWLYKFYSQYHLVENLLFEKKYSLNNISSYQNALCSMGREMALQTTDFNYNGMELRNDENRLLRGVSRGDSNSYEDPGSDSILKYSIITYYGLLCDDNKVKKQMIYLRNLANEKNDDGLAYLDAFLYPMLYSQVSNHPESINKIGLKFSYDNANDILTIRNNYTYTNDTIIEIDGGEERGGGHSQAQGYFLYALGEPFLDYEQVPYEDDVRAETWKNGISFQNATQTTEGTNGQYSDNCGEAPLNQYYGMSDCELTGEYPDYRRFPIKYGGDLEDYVGTNDSYFAGVYAWRPYKNADPVKEYFVKYGNVLIKRTRITNNEEGEIYHNFINILDEFNESRNKTENSITFSKNNKKLKIRMIYSNTSFTIGGGDSGVNYCFSKTSCEGSKRGKGHYRRTYYYSKSNNADFIISHNWYLTGDDDYYTEKTMNLINNDDKGVSFDNKKIIFDTNNDGQTIYEEKNIATNGWAIVFNDKETEIGSFNATYINNTNGTIINSSIPMSLFLKLSNEKIILTANSMARKLAIDYSREATITLKTSILTNNSGITIIDDEGNNIPLIREGEETITFKIKPGQNSNTYTITGSKKKIPKPEVTLISPENNYLSYYSNNSFKCSAYSKNAKLTSISLLINASGSMESAYTKALNSETGVLEKNLILGDGTYEWACSVTNNYSNITTSNERIIIINTEIINYPNITMLEPENNTQYIINTTNNQSINASCTVNDNDNNLKNITITINNETTTPEKEIIKKTIIFNETENKTTSTIWIIKELPKGNYTVNCKANDYDDHKTTKEYNFLITELPPPTATGFDGETTNFSSITSYENQKITLEKTTIAKLRFNNPITTLRGINFDKAIIMSHARIEVKTDEYPQLNVSANITFYNITLKNPVIMRGGVVCDDCEIINYSGGNFTFMVKHFTTYYLEENNSNSSTNSSTRTQNNNSGSHSQSKKGTASTRSGGGSGGSTINYNTAGLAFKSITHKNNSEESNNSDEKIISNSNNNQKNKNDEKIIIQTSPHKTKPVLESPIKTSNKEVISNTILIILIFTLILIIFIISTNLFHRRKQSRTNKSVNKSANKSVEELDETQKNIKETPFQKAGNNNEKETAKKKLLNNKAIKKINNPKSLKTLKKEFKKQEITAKGITNKLIKNHKMTDNKKTKPKIINSKDYQTTKTSQSNKPKIIINDYYTDEKPFYLSDGTVIHSISYLLDLMPFKQEVFQQHVNNEKNDFYNWIINVFNDEGLAESIRDKLDQESFKDSIISYIEKKELSKDNLP